MTHPITHFTAGTIDDLRHLSLKQAVENNTAFSNGFSFSWGEGGGKVQIDLASGPDALFTATTTVTGVPDWFCLSLSLGDCALAVGDVLGVTAEISVASPEDGLAFAPFIRAQRDNQTVDTVLRGALQFDATRSVQTLLHTFEPYDEVPHGAAGHHALIVPMPNRDTTWTLHDLRVFVVPAGRGLRSDPVTVASFAS